MILPDLVRDGELNSPEVFQLFEAVAKPLELWPWNQLGVLSVSVKCCV